MNHNTVTITTDRDTNPETAAAIVAGLQGMAAKEMAYEQYMAAMARDKDGNSGMDLLRQAVEALDGCREDFLDDFTPPQLLQIHAMWKASKWDIAPDEWTKRQIKEALAGKPPEWDRETEKPVYSPRTNVAL